MTNQWGYVYQADTIANMKAGYVKIGVTDNIERRMKELSTPTSQPENFMCWDYFRFENMADAKKVEKAIHIELTQLGLRVSKNKEFFHSHFLFKDVVNDVSDNMCIKTLSKGQLEAEHQNLDLYLPCRYFLLNDRKVFDDYCRIALQTIGFIDSIANFKDGAHLYDFPWGEIFSAPGHVAGEYPFASYMKDFDKKPYILAKMVGMYLNKREHFPKIFQENCEEQLDEYFYYNKNWRSSIKP